MGRRRATGLCEGCGRRAPAQHQGCTCPQCGGPKHRQAQRCGGCAGRGRGWHTQPDLIETSPSLPVQDRYVLSCVWCARTMESPIRPTRPLRCGMCGGNVISEVLV